MCPNNRLSVVSKLHRLPNVYLSTRSVDVIEYITTDTISHDPAAHQIIPRWSARSFAIALFLYNGILQRAYFVTPVNYSVLFVCNAILALRGEIRQKYINKASLSCYLRHTVHVTLPDISRILVRLLRAIPKISYIYILYCHHRKFSPVFYFTPCSIEIHLFAHTIGAWCARAYTMLWLNHYIYHNEKYIFNHNKIIA